LLSNEGLAKHLFSDTLDIFRGIFEMNSSLEIIFFEVSSASATSKYLCFDNKIDIIRVSGSLGVNDRLFNCFGGLESLFGRIGWDTQKDGEIKLGEHLSGLIFMQMKTFNAIIGEVLVVEDELGRVFLETLEE